MSGIMVDWGVPVFKEVQKVSDCYISLMLAQFCNFFVLQGL